MKKEMQEVWLGGMVLSIGGTLATYGVLYLWGQPATTHAASMIFLEAMWFCVGAMLELLLQLEEGRPPQQKRVGLLSVIFIAIGIFYLAIAIVSFLGVRELVKNFGGDLRLQALGGVALAVFWIVVFRRFIYESDN